MKIRSLLLFVYIGIISSLSAKISTPAIFGSNMVLQQNHKCPVWGKAEKLSTISLSFSGKTYQTRADEKGNWRVYLDPHPASNNPLKMRIVEESPNRKENTSSLTYENILVGEVWLCSGQSNMQWSVSRSEDSDLESLSAHYPNLRLITIPHIGTQEPQHDFKGAWQAANPTTAANFSAVGYFFGRRLHQILQVPVGLVNNSWGGSACEAWIPRDRLVQCNLAKPYLEEWQTKEKNHDFDSQLQDYKKRLAKWESDRKQGNAKIRRPREPRNPMSGQHRPANLYNGVLYPIIGYGIKGAIWYQGESNAWRAHAYRETFPLMIQTWREAWNQGDFPFYWSQLADFRNEVDTPGDSYWAELRESQTLTLKELKNVGEAVIIDAGEGHDIHPRNKQTVANRLLRHALVNEYGHQIPNRSPTYKSHEIIGNKIQITFDQTGDGLYCFDTKSPVGFAICGVDQNFIWAEANLIGKDKVEVWSDSISSPLAVRYAWSDNPVCNLYRKDGAVTLPVTPFRTDNFLLTTTGK